MPKPGVPESFKVLVKELQSLCLDIKVLDEDGSEIELREDDEDELLYTGERMPADDLPIYDETLGKNVGEDEAAQAGYEIQSEDEVFEIINEAVTGSDDN